MYKTYEERYLELKMLIEELMEKLSKVTTPAEETIMDDIDVQKLLKISKRKLAELRAERAITYRQPKVKPANKKSGVNERVGNLRKGNRRSKIHYLLIDVLEYLERNKVPAIADNIKLKGSGK